MKKHVVVAALVVFSFILLHFTGLLSFKGLCGFKPGHLTGPGKEWNCLCLGKTDYVSSSYSEKQYCTGINISYNRLIPLLYKGRQHPIYEPESL